jgi:pimeloyl-ACP methyl ester carboxylesterase
MSRSVSNLVLCFLALFLMIPSLAAQSRSTAITAHTATVDGVTFHYMRAGHGDAVLLLHGYAEDSRMWKPIIPLLAQHFTVIAPDLPGIGESSIPTDGLDMKSAGRRVHSLMQSLGIKHARVVGHDIGLMVAYSYTAQFPSEVDKLVLMDAFLPGVGDWETIYNNPSIWHFRFTGPTPEALVAGRERIYFEHYWNDFAADKRHSIPEAMRKAYTAAYSRPGRMRAGSAYFMSFPQAAKDFEEFARMKLTIPILALGGENANGNALGRQAQLVGTDVKVVVVPNCGHWMLEESPKATTQALVDFL